MNGPTLDAIAADLAAGRLTALDLVESCLARIADPAGEGARTFIHFEPDAVRATAKAVDLMRRSGTAPSRYAGIPISVKDLFDVEGQITKAGSIVLAQAPPAPSDATAIARLRRMGFILIGRTNMTEFAYSGLGLNPHYGTPLNPWRRDEGYIPGGSSSGAAISVSDSMAHAGLGTDTGGSCRIPAAFTGLVGYKPTARRIPLDGIEPLSSSLDSVGTIARSVSCCALLDAVLAGEPAVPIVRRPVAGIRLAIPTHDATQALDGVVSAAFERSLRRLEKAGARIEAADFPEFDDIAKINAKGGFTAPESFAWHRTRLADKVHLYDPRVAVRIMRGAEVSAPDYVEALAIRQSLIARVTQRLADYDAIAMPTVPIGPPRMRDLADDKSFTEANLAALRHCTLINMIDGCAISVPIADTISFPVGFMVAAASGADQHLFRIAAAIERTIAPSPVAMDRS